MAVNTRLLGLQYNEKLYWQKRGKDFFETLNVLIILTGFPNDRIRPP